MNRCMQLMKSCVKMYLDNPIELNFNVVLKGHMGFLCVISVHGTAATSCSKAWLNNLVLFYNNY